MNRDLHMDICWQNIKISEKLKPFEDQKKKILRNKNPTDPGFSAVKCSRKDQNTTHVVERKDWSPKA